MSSPDTNSGRLSTIALAVTYIRVTVVIGAIGIGVVVRVWVCGAGTEVTTAEVVALGKAHQYRREHELAPNSTWLLVPELVIVYPLLSEEALPDP